MALIMCPECGKQISEYADFCVGCGCPMHIIDQLNGTFERKGMYRLLRQVFCENERCVPVKDFPSIEYAQRLESVLVTLSLREEKVLKCRSGMLDGRIYTYEELARDWNISKKRVIEIETEALTKLRRSSRLKYLEVMWEFPLIESLKREAEKRGYLIWENNDEDPPIDMAEYAFGQCCFELLGMYDPLVVVLTLNDLRDMPIATRLEQKIENMELSVRSYNCLIRAGINTVGELVKLPYSKLECIRNLGRKSCEEIVEKLALIGLTLVEEPEG